MQGNPVDAYKLAVTSGDVPAGTYHRLACARHLEDRERKKTTRFPYQFDDARAADVVEFFAELKHYKTEWAGEPILLEPWQVFIVGSIFGWVRKQAPHPRRFRKAYVEIPRKNGKSVLGAGMSLYATFAEGEPGAEGYVVATKRDQAKDIVFHDAKWFVMRSKLSKQIFPSGKWESASNLHSNFTGSKLQALSKDHDSMDGLNVHFCLLDEFHAQKDRGIIDVMETAMGARRQPLMVEITTAGSDPLSPCGVEHDYACKLVDGTITDETFFAFIAHADEGDDPFAEATWRQANPNYGVSVKPEDLQALARKARNMPSALATFRQKRLNIWINTATPWYSMAGWRQGQSTEDDWVDDLAGQPCWIGVDLSSVADLSAVVAAFLPEYDGAPWRLLSRFFTPEDGLDERELQARAPYRQWVDEGHILPNDGNRIDQNLIKKVILEACDTYNVQRVGFDPWNADKLITEINEEWREDIAITIPQNFANMNKASQDSLADVAGGRVDTGGNPVQEWMFSNAVFITDSYGNIRPTKDPKKSRGRIDGVVAAIMAMRLAATEPVEPEIDPRVGVLVW